MTKPPKYRIRIPDITDIKREIYMQAGARDAYRFLRKHGTNPERVLESAGLSAKLADFLTEKEAVQLAAAFAGLKPGRTALTIPELLVISWSLKAGYSFGGVWPNITNQGADFFSQYPLEGGRYKAGGNVTDVFFSANASRTTKGLSLSVDGSYFHSKTATASRDTAQNMLLQSQGYKVARIVDTQVLQPGVLDQFMTNLVGKKP